MGVLGCKSTVQAPVPEMCLEVRPRERLNTNSDQSEGNLISHKDKDGLRRGGPGSMRAASESLGRKKKRDRSNTNVAAGKYRWTHR